MKFAHLEREHSRGRAIIKYLTAASALLLLSAAGASASPIIIDGFFGTKITSNQGPSPNIVDDFGNPIFFNNFVVPVGATPTSPVDLFTVSAPCSNFRFDNYCPTEKGKVDVSFSFLLPSGVTGTVSDSALYSFSNGSGSLTWTDLVIPVEFQDGDTADIYLTNASDPSSGTVSLTPTISFGPSVQPVPEPLTLSIFGSGLAGLAGLKKLRKRRSSAG